MSIVEIAGEKYEVRRMGESRLIRPLTATTWLNPQEFVDYLLENGKVESVASLMEYGMKQ